MVVSKRKRTSWSYQPCELLPEVSQHTHTHTPPSHFPWIWKCDVRKFFDSVDHEILLKILSFRIKNSTTQELLKEVINSFSAEPSSTAGMPIGNLTSQIFANVYLNELDRFVKHTLKAEKYLRYGDDFIIVSHNPEQLKVYRYKVIDFLHNTLRLEVNSKNDKIIKATYGLKFLGVKFWPFERYLSKRNQKRIEKRLALNNVASYRGLVKQHGTLKEMKKLDWWICENLNGF